MTESDEDYYDKHKDWISPYRIVRQDQILHPDQMDVELAALVMRSLRWLGNEDQGGYQMDPPRREGYLRLAQAFEDYLSLAGGGGMNFGVKTHYPDGITSNKAEEDELIEDALKRMKGLFDRKMFVSLGW